MFIPLTLIGAACLAAVAPWISQSSKPSFAKRLKGFFAPRANSRANSASAFAPPQIINESGWTMIQCDDPDSFRTWLGKDSEGLPYKEGESPSLGSHLLVELFDCSEESLQKETCVGKAMRDAAIESKATVVAESFHEFKPYGVSGAVIIQESHYTIHTWPEHHYAAVDLFYCGGTVHVQKAIDVLIERFQPKRMKFLVVRRGIESEVAR